MAIVLPNQTKTIYQKRKEIAEKEEEVERNNIITTTDDCDYDIPVMVSV